MIYYGITLVVTLQVRWLWRVVCYVHLWPSLITGRSTRSGYRSPGNTREMLASANNSLSLSYVIVTKVSPRRYGVVAVHELCCYVSHPLPVSSVARRNLTDSIMLFALSGSLPPLDGINVCTAVCQSYHLQINEVAAAANKPWTWNTWNETGHSLWPLSLIFFVHTVDILLYFLILCPLMLFISRCICNRRVPCHPCRIQFCLCQIGIPFVNGFSLWIITK